MFDINRHKILLIQILKDIYSDIELSARLGFKGGTALMFFYGLPRFSVDLDFNLIEDKDEKAVYEKIRRILLNYGTIYDEALKYYGLLIVLDYGKSERKMKIEISKRIFDNQYEIKNFLGINIKVMVLSDMFAHKLCALLDRRSLTGRDVFDCWFFMNNHTAINKNIVEKRMGMPLAGYIQKCIDRLESANEKKLLQEMGELMDEEMKKFVRTKLLQETIRLLKFYKEFPIL